jgi:hypothetical protein
LNHRDYRRKRTEIFFCGLRGLCGSAVFIRRQVQV